MSTASHAVTLRDDTQPLAPAVSETAAIVQMIERAASNPAVDIDKLERLLEMQERVLARNARAAFAAAFAGMQQELPTIPERGRGDRGMKYALWEDVNEAIKPVLARHGFGISFKTGRTPERVSVTAILMHRDGHSEETTLELPVDSSGSKNAVQAVGSSTSYGKRYTAAALLNLTSRGEDDDGRAAGLGPRITEDQTIELRDLAREVGADLPRFLATIRVDSLAEIRADKFEEAKRLLERKRGR
ncbi:ERF family protein [Methylobacterium nodulans]|uniref:ERF family protein n=1 Tax=Methylobacterium nodulans (strain LMG 21967 / CNCM I-2342 / ORS 2060) TaxID=460265 RepID=B8IRI4_METNO|nr:ERF family protein [Methylobacterium nodulans]ACL58724.1 ERF family protein [Methylobacterium nodulans ORS 2060]